MLDRRLWTPVLLCLAFVATLLPTAGAVELSYYLLRDLEYDGEVPTPSSVLGYELGDWHVRHDQLVRYFEVLAESSDRVQLELIGTTYEQRPLLVATISSPENLSRLEEIRAQHLRLSDPNETLPDVSRMPAVVYLGYSVHGNESSGSNAALAVAYLLAAGRGPQVDDLLRNTVILLDPSLNPDGLSRFAHWANMHKGENLVADPRNREHNEGWPNGRTNHYWFDLNRDWLLLQHPESRARIEVFHRWKPNILCDYHEMGSNSTFFFQPGVPSRRNPITPEKNVELTSRIARYHANALDALGSIYFTEERFDDYYYGKGSTYPDANGGIGILFEQASARGHRMETQNGTLTFPFTIRNQCVTSYSTLQAALEMREDLLRYQHQFYREAVQEAKRDPIKGCVFGDAKNLGASLELVSILRRHGIDVRELARTHRQEDLTFEPGSAFVVPLGQPQYRLARSMLELRTSFPDSIFYDVSTWNFPLAFDVPFTLLRNLPRGLMGDSVTDVSFPAAEPLPEDPRTVAYAFKWNEYYSARVLFRLLDRNVRARVATKPFTASTHRGEVAFDPGTVIVPMGIQERDAGMIRRLLDEASAEDGVDAYSIKGGLTPQGIDMGSPSLRVLEKPVPALLCGSGVSTYESGELWHLLDQRFDVPVTLLELSQVGRADLEEYTHLIMVNGSYGRLSEGDVESIKEWVRNGGVLVATKGATEWVASQELMPVLFRNEPDSGQSEEDKEMEAPSPKPRRDYAQAESIEDAQRISGAIFAADVDLTHPLGYGFTDSQLPVFRNGRRFIEPASNPYGTVVRYEAKPLLSGYVTEGDLARAGGSASVIAQRVGRGTVVLMAEDPSFRAIWYGTSRLFLNALFFGNVISRTGE